MTSRLASAVVALLRAEAGELRRVCADSRTVMPGDVFLAYPGHASDGRCYIRDAISRGACAVLWERDGFEWPPELLTPNLPVDHLRGLASEIASAVLGQPSEKLWLIGVTGTNGKTTVSQWLARVLTKLGKRTAVIGTLGAGFPGEMRATANTTPDAVLLQEALSRFVEQGAEAVTMEVSSIGLDQGRISACAMDLAIFTNLTRDHLDYHKSMESYAAAKAKLFDMPGLRGAVLNFDDLMGVVLARRLANEAGPKVLGYTLVSDNMSAAPASYMLVAESVRTTSTGMSFKLRFEDQCAELIVGVLGLFNVSNLMAVIGACILSGYDFESAVEVVQQLSPPEGRMQTLGGIGEPLIIVDYAHTPDALEQVLLALKQTAASRHGRLCCVFGCGGDRDAGKRAMMGEVAARLAERVVITSDNPRSEDPHQIIKQVSAGAPEAECIADRAEAIRLLIVEAGENDVILVAGKGHEDYQEIKGQKLYFSDTGHANAALTMWNINKRELRS